MKRKNLSLFLLAVLVMAALSLSTPGFAADAIKLGILVPLTGPAADHGPLMVEGAKLAINEINAKGGVLGQTTRIGYLGFCYQH